MTRLWFALSVIWAAIMLGVLALSHDSEPVGWGVWLVIFGPFVVGLLFKRIGRYVVKGD